MRTIEVTLEYCVVAISVIACLNRDYGFAAAGFAACCWMRLHRGDERA